MAVIYINDQNNLKSIEDRVKQLQEELQEYLDGHQNQELIQTVIASADGLALRYEYEEALVILKQHDIIQSNETIKAKIVEYQTALDNMVVYSEDIQIIFFHTLVNNTKLAFDGKSGYDLWTITNNEFKAIIQQLYDREYILYDIHDAYDLTAGKMGRKVVKVPAGKIPLILMVDEMAYQDPMPLKGYARGMGIRDGEIVSRILTAEGVDYTKDGDVVPIVEEFLKTHPDFSFRGARGVLSLTGFAGTLGYRLTNDIEVNDAKLLADLLKEKGWDFACTTYADLEDIYVTNPTYAKIKADLKKWDDKIKPIVGDSLIFVSPYGNRLSGDNLRAIREYGYTTYFYDDNRPNETVSESILFLSRVGITGRSFTTNASYINENYFKISEILDPAR